MLPSGLFGYGYEGKTQLEVLDLLIAGDIQVLVDVRLNPLSRRPGLSKTKLGMAAEERGIQYLHLRELGNPRENRAGFADLTGLEGRRARTRYRDILRGTPGSRALEVLVDLSRSHRVAALCFEADERLCHRELVVKAAADLRRRRQNSIDASKAFG